MVFNNGVLGKGTSGLITTGNGIVTLASATDSYAGATTINGGTLQVAADGDLGGTASSLVTINSGTLEVTATFASNHLYVLGSPSSTISVDAGKSFTVNNPVSGSGR